MKGAFTDDGIAWSRAEPLGYDRPWVKRMSGNAVATVLVTIIVLGAAFAAGMGLKALGGERPAPPTVMRALATEEDEAKAVEELDEEVRSLQQQLTGQQARISTRFEQLRSHARGRTGLSIDAPLDFDRKQRKWVAPASVTSASTAAVGSASR